MKFKKKWVVWAILGAALYFILSYHFIFIDDSLNLLKKSNLTLNYTFFSTKSKSNESILAIDELREDGIGDLLVETGRMSEEDRQRLIAKFE